MKARKKPTTRLPRSVWFIVNPRGVPVDVCLQRPHIDALAAPYVRSLPKSQRLDRGAGVLLPRDREEAEAAGWHIIELPLRERIAVDQLTRLAFLNAETALEGLVEAYEQDKDRVAYRRYSKELAQIRAHRLKHWGKTAFEVGVESSSNHPKP